MPASASGWRSGTPNGLMIRVHAHRPLRGRSPPPRASHPTPSIGPGVRIGEFCVIEPDVVIGAECVLEPYVYIKRWTTLGERNEICAGTVLGTDPLDKNFNGERSYLPSATATRSASTSPSRAARRPNPSPRSATATSS